MTFFVAAFLVVAGPWYARQLAVFGSLSPSAANGRILWITTYQELWSVGSDSSLAAFLGQGPDSLLASRLGGLAAALLIFAGVPLLLYLAPLTAVGAWVRGRDRLFLPWSIYALTLLAVNALLFAVHVPYGTFLHSAGALVPHAYVLAVGGVSVAVAWVARRRSSWQVQRATRNFTALAVGVMFLGAAGAVWRIHSTWSAEAAIRQRISDSLPAHARSDVVMSPDPGAYRYLAGVRGVVTPDDPLPVIREAAAAYGVRWLILERAHVVDALAPVVAGEQRPEWLSRPLTEVGGRPPSAALFAVCLEPRDERCRG